MHLKGTMFTNAAAFRAVRDYGGSIINFSSGAGVTGDPNGPVYAAAKAAILGYTRSVALDWGKHMVRVNALCPGAITPAAEASFEDLSPGALARTKMVFAQRVPLGGWLGTAEQTASVVVFLASDASSYMTGQTIGVDGGGTMPR